MTANNLQKIQGEWCYGCHADCEFKKPSRWGNNNHVASLGDLKEFIKNVNIVTQKTIAKLQEQLNAQECDSC